MLLPLAARAETGARPDIDERFAYARVAALPREEPLALARGVYEQSER